MPTEGAFGRILERIRAQNAPPNIATRQAALVTFLQLGAEEESKVKSMIHDVSFLFLRSPTKFK